MTIRKIVQAIVPNIVVIPIVLTPLVYPVPLILLLLTCYNAVVLVPHIVERKNVKTAFAKIVNLMILKMERRVILLQSVPVFVGCIIAAEKIVFHVTILLLIVLITMIVIRIVYQEYNIIQGSIHFQVHPVLVIIILALTLLWSAKTAVKALRRAVFMFGIVKITNACYTIPHSIPKHIVNTIILSI